ncbi:membrane protein [Mycolicibacillus koreensis]|nr:membrane protein [Mycolicibacillus koreensis]
MADKAEVTVADRDPDTIKKDIDQARDQLASTVDLLAERANPRRLADDLKATALRIVKKPVVTVSLAGVGALVVVVTVRKIRNR